MTTRTTTTANDARLVGYRPGSRGTLPHLPPEEALPDDLLELRATVEARKDEAKAATDELARLKRGRTQVESDYQRLIAEAANEGKPAPKSPIPKLEALIVDTGHKAAGLKQAAEAAMLEFGRGVVAYRQEELPKREARLRAEKVKLVKLLEQVEKQIAVTEEVDSHHRWWLNSESHRVTYRRPYVLGYISTDIKKAKDKLEGSI